MDSGNSGSLSLQSSSGGGDDEFDSRCGGGGDEDSSPLSALLRQPPATSSSAAQLPGFGGSSAFYGVHDLTTPPPTSHRTSATTPLPTGGAGASSAAPHSSSSQGDQAAALAAPAQQAPAARASRKRTRASRRAPTTVLTTDTSNFRAMVQEFTGVPAPPFTPGGSSARSSRFDHLFSSRPAAAAALSSPYLLRPFAHKLQQAPSSPYPPQPFVATSSPANKAIAPSSAPRTTTASASYQQLASAPTSVLGMQDHGNYLSFQSPVLSGNASRYSMFDAAGPPPARQRLPDPDGFMGLAHGQMNSRHRRDHASHGGGDELSGLLGSVSGAADGSASRAAPPRTTRVVAGAAAATSAVMRAQGGVESSWICTSDQ